MLWYFLEAGSLEATEVKGTGMSDLDAEKSTGGDSEDFVAASEQESGEFSKPANSETDEAHVDDKMSKGEDVLSSEGKFFEKDDKNKIGKMQESSDTSKKVQQLISLRKRIEEIDKKTELLNKKDRDMKRSLVQMFTRTKKNALKQIRGFKALLQRLKKKQGTSKREKVMKMLDKLIQRVKGNIKTHQDNLKYVFIVSTICCLPHVVYHILTTDY